MNLFLVKLYSLLNPLVAFAQNEIVNPNNNQIINPTLGGSDPNNIQIVFTNPLGGSGGISNINQLIGAILDIVITVGIPLVVLAVIYSGFLFVTAMGDKEKLKTARSAFLWTIVGGLILLSSWVIAQALESTIQQIIN
ncbi:MAG: hypothetical protein ACI88L_000600 [Candidatus Paceibacteria bacterium]|jgi:hypothetical protein